MTNGLIGRFVLQGSLTAVTPLSIGSDAHGPVADIACFRDGLGRLTIPGTSLAGVLRRTVEDDLWGKGDGDRTNDEAEVSRFFVEDCFLEDSLEHTSGSPSDSDLIDVRDGVTIDRNTGAAAEHMLHTRETIAAGTIFACQITLDVVHSPEGEAGNETTAAALMAQLVARMKSGFALGGSTTRGLGEVQLNDDAEVRWVCLSNRDSFLQSLLSGPTTYDLSTVKVPSDRNLTVSIPWRQLSPLLVSVAMSGGVDARPRTVRRDGKTYLTVPGSSIKGVLRSRAEKIMRSLAQEDSPDSPLESFQNAPSLVAELFGRGPDRNGKGGRRGAVRCLDVVAVEPIKDWNNLLEALKQRKPDERIKAAKKVKGSDWLLVDDHVAISRWTGGASDGKLFAQVSVWPRTTPSSPPDVTVAEYEVWEPIRLKVDLARLDSKAEAAIMLLAFVLRDLCEGWISVGYGTTRGYGEIEADPSRVSLNWPDDDVSRPDTLRSLFDDESGAVFEKAWIESLRLTPVGSGGTEGKD
ncbi:MAG: RAMP superfamily CRISPR-associated protein [Ancrocorticia sp.]